MTRLSTLLGALALVLAALGVVTYVAYFYSVSMDGSYSLNLSVSGGRIEGIVIELPTDGKGGLVYRVRDFSASIAHGLSSEDVEPVLSDYVNGYPSRIEIPYTFGEGDYIVSGEFTLDPVLGVNYSAYPWELSIGGERFYVNPVIQESLGFKLILMIKEYALSIMAGLAALAAGLGAASIIVVVRGPVFQEGPIPPAAAKGCGEWCTLCVRLFRVGVEEKEERRFPKGFVESFLRLLNKVNEVWGKCCIRAYPCIEDGQVSAHYLGPTREVAVEVMRRKASVGGAKLVYRVARRVKASDIFDDLEHGVIKAMDGKVKVKYKEFAEAWWASDGEYGGTHHKKGQALSPEELRRFLDDALARLTDQASREEAARVRDLVEPREAKGYVEVTKILEALAEVHGHPRRCVDVFVVGRYEEVGKRVRGFASTPGRSIVVSSSVIDYGMAEVLAHELGHNLSLRHVNEPGNLMEAAINGTNLSREQCEAASKDCRSRKERLHSQQECGDGGKILKAIKKKDELSEELEKTEKKLKRLRNELVNLPNRVKECRKKRAELWREYKKAEYVYTHLRGFCKKVKRLKAKRKEKALDREREYAQDQLDKWRKTNPDSEQTRVYEERIKAIDGDPEAVANSLKAEMERLRQEYEICKRYTDKPKEVEKELRQKIKEAEKSIEDLKRKIDEAEETLRNYLPMQ